MLRFLSCNSCLISPFPDFLDPIPHPRTVQVHFSTAFGERGRLAIGRLPVFIYSSFIILPSTFHASTPNTFLFLSVFIRANPCLFYNWVQRHAAS
jgi:hypothetical protein